MASGVNTLFLLWIILLTAVRDSQQLVRGSSLRSRISRSDDSNLASLQTLVEQQASMIQSQAAVIQSLQSRLQAEENRVAAIQTDVTSLKNKLAASNAVAFTVHFGHDGGQDTGVPLSQHSTLIFDSVTTNIGNGYDSHTGVFTAPVSGVYSFFLTQMSADGPRELWLSIRKDGSALDRVYSEGETDTHDQGASQVTTHLQVGQKVWVRQEVGSGVRGGYFTVFTGYLVQAD